MFFKELDDFNTISIQSFRERMATIHIRHETLHNFKSSSCIVLNLKFFMKSFLGIAVKSCSDRITFVFLSRKTFALRSTHDSHLLKVCIFLSFFWEKNHGFSNSYKYVQNFVVPKTTKNFQDIVAAIWCATRYYNYSCINHIT